MEEKKGKSWNESIKRITAGSIGFLLGTIATIYIVNTQSSDYKGTIFQQNAKKAHIYYEKTKEFTYQIMDLPNSRKLNIFSAEYPEEDKLYLSAYDLNKNGYFETLERRIAGNSKIDAIANFDSIDVIYRKISKKFEKIQSDEEFRKNYLQHETYWKDKFPVPFDTLVRAEYGGMYALTDISKNGVDYDIIQYLGNSPGAYSITISSDYKDELEKNKGLMLIPYGSNVYEKTRRELDNEIKNIIK